MKKKKVSPRMAQKKGALRMELCRLETRRFVIMEPSAPLELASDVARLSELPQHEEFVSTLQRPLLRAAPGLK